MKDENENPLKEYKFIHWQPASESDEFDDGINKVTAMALRSRKQIVVDGDEKPLKAPNFSQLGSE